MKRSVQMKNYTFCNRYNRKKGMPAASGTYVSRGSIPRIKPEKQITTVKSDE